MSKRREKIANVMTLVKARLDDGSFRDTRHAEERRSQRFIERETMIYALKNGYHEKRKDKYDEHYQTWNYAIRGKTLENKKLRIIVSFDENNMLIITAIELK